MDFLSIFRAHPASVGEGYFEHMRRASGFGARMILGGLACLVHAVFPFLCVRTGSAQVDHLHQSMITRRQDPLAEAQQAQPRPAR